VNEASFDLCFGRVYVRYDAGKTAYQIEARGETEEEARELVHRIETTLVRRMFDLSDGLRKVAR
jgi:hypothetical protein